MPFLKHTWSPLLLILLTLLKILPVIFCLFADCCAYLVFCLATFCFSVTWILLTCRYMILQISHTHIECLQIVAGYPIECCKMCIVVSYTILMYSPLGSMPTNTHYIIKLVLVAFFFFFTSECFISFFILSINHTDTCIAAARDFCVLTS